MIRLIVRMASKFFFVFIGAMITSLKPVFFFPEHVPPRSVSCSERLWLGHETLTLAKKLRMDFLRTGKETKRHRKRHTDKHTVYHKHTHAHTHPTLSPFGQLSGKQDVSQLALCVGPERVVILLPAQVIKLDLAHVVSSRWQVDDPGWGWVFQQVQQQIGQEEMTWRGRKEVEAEGAKWKLGVGFRDWLTAHPHWWE